MRNFKNQKQNSLDVAATLRRKCPSDFSESTRLTVVDLYVNEALAATNIAKKLNLSYSNVRTLLKRSGVTMRSESEKSKLLVYRQIRTCKHSACNAEFQIINPAQVYCRICAPTKRAYARLKYYDLSQPEFESLWNSHHGLCKLCDVKLVDGGSTNMNVDHCHQTGKVRGLVCHRCNIVLGFMDKTSLDEQFQRLTTYLGSPETYQTTDALFQRDEALFLRQRGYVK